jgi:hypothetical protein
MDFEEIGLIHLAGDSDQWCSYGHGNEYSGSEKGIGFFDQLKDC